MNFDFGDSPKQMFDKILDGDLDTANQLFADIIKGVANTASEHSYKRARNDMDRVYQERTEKSAEQTVIDELESTYDFFNPGNEQAFDPDAVNETLALQRGFIEQGYSRADAMRSAANYVVTMRRANEGQPEPAQQPTLGGERQPAPETEQPAATKQDSTPAPRKPEDIDRNLKAQQSQPPRTAGEGNDTRDAGLPDLSKLSEEEIDALPEATIKRLRGDFV